MNIDKLYLILLLPIFMFGVFGTVVSFSYDNPNPLAGFLWGVGVGLAVLVVSLIGTLGYKWIVEEINKGKLFPYILIGITVGIIISGYLAIDLGSPSCDEYSNEPNGSCIQYADDGFETTSSQKWDKFWSVLPITVIITSLIAIIVHSKTQNK